MSVPELIELAKATARKHVLDPALVAAVCEQESSWNPWAMRFEPGFLARYIKPTLPDAPTTGEIARATSWGLMQVLGQTAFELGFNDKYFSSLCDPSVGLLWGCTKLAKCIDSRSDQRLALLMWNGGGRPQYADEVLARMKNYY